MRSIDIIGASGLIDKIQASIPYKCLRTSLLETVIAQRVHPEIIISHSDLDNFPKSEYIALAREIADAGLRCTIHAPFLDLRPGGLDPQIRQISFGRIKRCLELSFHFNPIAIICHHAFDAKYYISKKEEWLENSLRFWGAMVEFLPPDARIALENVHETTPREIKHIIKTINSEKLRFCFDSGHCNCFAGGSYQLWIEELGAYLTDMHIHDNSGASDEHLPPLEGTFPFADFLAFLAVKNIKPRITVEAGSIKTLARALQNLEHLGLSSLLAR